MSHTSIPPEELEVFKHLPDVEVVIDVGARADTDYLDLKPGITLHAFEPHPEFFKELQEAVGDRPNVYLNNYGLSDVEAETPYSDQLQAFMGGEAPTSSWERILPLKTLDWYVEENNICLIDFLKVDVEGYDYKVFVGGKKAVEMSRFIQYEYWDDLEEFEFLFKEEFDMEYIGYRNVLCMNKKLVPQETREKLTEYIDIMGYRRLS